MALHINGWIDTVFQPAKRTRKDGTDITDRDGNPIFEQLVILQTDWEYADPRTGEVRGRERKVAITIISNSTHKRISTFDLKPGEEIEMTVDIESREYQDRWYTNHPNCFAIERDKSKWKSTPRNNCPRQYEAVWRPYVAPQPQAAAPAAPAWQNQASGYAPAPAAGGYSQAAGMPEDDLPF